MDLNTIGSILSVVSTVGGGVGIALKISKGFMAQSRATATLVTKVDRISQNVDDFAQRFNQRLDNLDRRLSHLEVEKENSELINIPSWLK